MVDPIATIVRRVRERSSTALAELADKAHVRSADLAAFEAGTGTISTAALRRVALVLELDPDALLDGREETRRPVVAFFRQHAIADVYAEDIDRLETAFEAATSFAELRALAGEPTPRMLDLLARPTEADATGDGIARAAELRARLDLSDDPIIDIVSLIVDRLGIFLVATPLKSTSILGATIKRRKADAAAIVLNASHAHFTDRQIRRATLAHELCHAVFDPSKGTIGVRLDRDAPGDSGFAGSAEEVRARAFQANLLVPEGGVERLLKAERRPMITDAAVDAVGLLRSSFWVSADIAVNRLLQLHWIDRATYDNLRWRSWQWVNIPDGEVPVAADPRLALKPLVLRALASSTISRMRAREVLGLTAWDDLPSA